MTLHEFALAAGIDEPAFMEYAMHNEALACKVMKMYLRDPAFDQLTAALVEGDMQSVRSAAHTLKGVSASLGMTRLFTLAKALVEAADAGQNALFPAMYQQISQEQAAVIALIEKLD